MDNTFSIVLKSLGLGMAGLVAISFLQQIPKRQQTLEDFKNAELKSFNYLSKSMKEGETVYLKAKVVSTPDNAKNTIVEAIPIYYNQFYLEEPSDLSMLKKLENRQVWEPLFKNNLWKLADSEGKTAQFYGMKVIVGDPYTIKRDYKEQKIGIAKEIWGRFCYMIEILFDVFRKSKYHDPLRDKIPIERAPVIKGPMVGLMKYTISLMTDAYFILKINFENGFHDIQILAESRYALLQYYQTSIFEAKLGAMIFIAISSLLGYMISKDIKSNQYIQTYLQALKKGNKKWLQLQNVEAECSCIICYTSCRNLILFDCKHLVMCWKCWNQMKHEECPICKKQITTVKVVLEDDEPQEKAVISD